MITLFRRLSATLRSRRKVHTRHLKYFSSEHFCPGIASTIEEEVGRKTTNDLLLVMMFKEIALLRGGDPRQYAASLHEAMIARLDIIQVLHGDRNAVIAHAHAECDQLFKSIHGALPLRQTP